MMFISPILPNYSLPKIWGIKVIFQQYFVFNMKIFIKTKLKHSHFYPVGTNKT